MDKNVGVIHGTLQTRVVYHHILCMFSKGTRIKDSNEAEVLAILEALRIFPHHFQAIIIVESNSSNAISWVTISDRGSFSLVLMRSKCWKPIFRWTFIDSLGQ